MQIKDMSAEELKALIQQTVEQTMLELLGDPDEGLDLRDEVKARLRASLDRQKEGERGISAEAVAKKFGMDW